ncbi:MAG: DUF2721 domain-containing protein [Bacteroidales bacterium]
MDASQNFILFLQSSITPVALISGVGLLLLTITNRLGRTIDRTRQLVADLDHPGVMRADVKSHEIKVLYRRSRYLRNSIAFIVISVFASSLIIPLLFIMSLTGLDLRTPGYALFILSIVSILVSSVYFLKDIILSLHAIRLEAAAYLPE